MPIDANFWLTDKAQRLLEGAHELVRSNRSLSAQDIELYRKAYSQFDSASITESLTFAELMKKASERAKLPALPWLFTRATYEQSTAPAIAKHHAEKYLDCKRVAEVCTGSGSDALSISQIAAFIESYESDNYIASLARINFSRHQRENITVITQEVGKDHSWLNEKFDGFWADPARRTSSRRVYLPRDYSPPLDWLLSLRIAPIMGIKISPIANLQPPLGWSREWIGMHNECREQTLWRGTDVIDGSVWLADQNIEWKPKSKTPEKLSAIKHLSVGDYLIEPHAALIRSGFVSSWLAEQSAELIDYTIAYGYATQPLTHSPFASTFKIISVFPFSYKKLQSAILSCKFTSSTEIKKRGFPEEPEIIRQKLRFCDSGEQGTIILTRHNNTRIALLCRRL